MNTRTGAGKIVPSCLPGNCVRAVVSLLTLLAFCGTGPACLAEEGNPTEADITRATATLLARSQFLQQPLDERLSGEFLDRYLDTLDGAHLLFLQSDLDEFARFRPGLAERTILDGDTQPAHFIYTRYLKRLAQEAEFAANLLHEMKFDFTGHDAWQADRHDAPRPRDLEAAQALWREDVREDYLQEKLAGDPPATIVSTLARHYQGRLQAMERLGADEVLGIYLDALAHVYDPHSDYFGHLDAENFNIEMNLSLTGIGGTLQTSGGLCVITDLVPGGPAARSGLVKPGDRIVAVAQEGGEPVDVAGMPSGRVVELVRGPKGSTVRLTIIPAGAGKSAQTTVSLVRDEVKLSEAEARAALIDLLQPNGQPLRIGVLQLPLFYGKGDKGTGAADDTARLLKQLKQAGMHGLILDLRRNGGGSLDEAIRLTGLFIPSGPVVQTLGLEDDIEVDISPQPDALYAGPLVVLTSRLSASASEIVAGALQDYGRALIVGDSCTFGKGTMQTVVPLKALFHQRGLGAVNVTIGKFYRPSGASTQLKGVVPDIVLPSETDLPDIGESRLPNALPWNILPPVSYTNFDLVRPVVAALREKSSARVATDPGFRLVREELGIMKRDEEAQSISLNEAERREEKTQADQVRAEMKQVLLADAACTPPACYLITPGKVDSAMPPAAAASPAALNAGGDIELREAENILADYIHALPASAAMLACSPVGQASNK
ncbi:MAG: carboxy terminal-processing peptidase [Limisphaerales bacterium]